MTVCRFTSRCCNCGLSVKAKFHYAIQLANKFASWFTSWSATCSRAGLRNGIWPIRRSAAR